MGNAPGKKSGSTSTAGSLFRQGRELARSVYQSVREHSDFDDEGGGEEEEKEEHVDLLSDLWRDVDAILLKREMRPEDLDQLFQCLVRAGEVLLSTPSKQLVNRSALALLQHVFRRSSVIEVHEQVLDHLLNLVQHEDTKKRVKLKALEAIKLAFLKREEAHGTELFAATINRLLRLLSPSASANNKQEEDAVKLQILDLIDYAIMHNALDFRAKNLTVLFEAVQASSSTSLEVKLRVCEVFDDYVRQCDFTNFSSEICSQVCDQFAQNKHVEVKKAELDVLRDCLKREEFSKHYAKIFAVLFTALGGTGNTDLKLRVLETFDTVLRKRDCAEFHEEIMRLMFRDILDASSSSNSGSAQQQLELQCEVLDLLRAVLTIRNLSKFHLQAEAKYVEILLRTKPATAATAALKSRVIHNLLLLFKRKNLCMGFQRNDDLVHALSTVFSASSKERAETKRGAICVLILLFKAHDAGQHDASIPNLCLALATNVLNSPNQEDAALAGVALELLCLLRHTCEDGDEEEQARIWAPCDAVLADALLQTKRLEAKEVGELLTRLVTTLPKKSLGPQRMAFGIVHALAKAAAATASHARAKPSVVAINALLFAAPQFCLPALFANNGFAMLFVCNMEGFILKSEAKQALLLQRRDSDSNAVPGLVKAYIRFEEALVERAGGSVAGAMALRKLHLANAKLCWALCSSSKKPFLPPNLVRRVWELL